MSAALRQLDRTEYPRGMLEIPDPPETLWMRGSWPAEGTRYLAVVGSRALTQYGKAACEKLIAGLAGYPISIVSGLALGADACAHRAALRAGLHTTAFPGSGINDDAIGPRSNVPLAAEILSAGGALLSEREPDEPSRAQFFPARNRLMVGIADAVLIIEAGELSGTLITARLASEYNRDLLCVPHRIGDPHGFGSHLFIRLGAMLVTEPVHILEALHIPPRSGISEGDLALLDDSEKAMYAVLKEPAARDDAMRRSKLPPGTALTALVSLELKGLAKEEFGLWRRV